MKLYLVYRCSWVVNQHKDEVKNIDEIVGIFRKKENAEAFKQTKTYTCEIDEVESDLLDISNHQGWHYDYPQRGNKQ